MVIEFRVAIEFTLTDLFMALACLEYLKYLDRPFALETSRVTS